MKATDQQLLDAYAELRSVHRVGERFGMHGSSAHERLVKLGARTSSRAFTAAELERIRREYPAYRAEGRAGELATAMGRPLTSLSRVARAMGLTTDRYPKPFAAVWKYLSDERARELFDDFKASPLGVMQWCRKNGFDDEGFRDAIRTRWPDEWEHVVESKALLTGKYRIGRQLEYRVRDLLRTNGYFVNRSPASRSPIDLVAIRSGEVLFVQCKRGGALPVKEWNALFDLAVSVNAVPVMAENPYPRTLLYWRLTDRKDGSRRRQPMEPFTPGDDV